MNAKLEGPCVEPFADADADADAAAPARAYLSFRLGDAEYGVEVLRVQEIRSYEPPTRLANVPAFVKGVLNLRGSIVPIVDLRIQLGCAAATYDALTVVIVLKLGSRAVGVVADAVCDVVEVEGAPLETAAGGRSGPIRGIAVPHGLTVLDIDHLVGQADAACAALAG